MIEDLSGRVAVITGGASGIGRALAVACQAAGMTVVIADLEAGALALAVEELGVEVVQTDVTDPDSVAHLASTVIERFGSCDLLCNNAGVAGNGTIMEQTLNDWNWVIDVNLRGVVHVLHAFLPSMLANPRGAHIVNTASIAGLTAVVSGPYTATKYAVVGISETLRTELNGTNVGISVLCPGLVKTKLYKSERNRPAALANEDTTGRSRKWALPTDTPPKVLDPSDVADMVLRAVRNNQFWILTDPSLLALSWPRYDELRDIAFGASTGPSPLHR
jgi:NAD(P)-dependent dehydrogenase (short-subunit alcohol dehydrogenase family)